MAASVAVAAAQHGWRQHEAPAAVYSAPAAAKLQLRGCCGMCLSAHDSVLLAVRWRRLVWQRPGGSGGSKNQKHSGSLVATRWRWQRQRWWLQCEALRMCTMQHASAMSEVAAARTAKTVEAWWRLGGDGSVGGGGGSAKWVAAARSLRCGVQRASISEVAAARMLWHVFISA